MEHLLNCHGEWAALAGFLSALPFLGTWLRAKSRHSEHEED